MVTSTLSLSCCSSAVSAWLPVLSLNSYSGAVTAWLPVLSLEFLFWCSDCMVTSTQSELRFLCSDCMVTSTQSEFLFPCSHRTTTSTHSDFLLWCGNNAFPEEQAVVFIELGIFLTVFLGSLLEKLEQAVRKHPPDLPAKRESVFHGLSGQWESKR